MVLRNIIKNKISKVTQLALFAGMAAFSNLALSTPVHADFFSHHKDDALILGVELETEFWTLVQEHNVRGFSKKLSKIFQGLNINGAYTRADQISGLSSANLTGFTITNPVATRFKDALVLTYILTATGTGITSGPNISTWKKHEGKWKMISHCYVPGSPI